MSQSLVNSFEGTILAGGNFTGGKEVINGAISIICALYTTTNLTIETYQSADNINYYSFSSFVHDVAIYGTHTRTQFYIEGRWGYIKVSNNTGGNATGVLFSTLYSANNHDGTIQQPTYIQGNVSVTSIAPITGSVGITSRSGSGFLSYLTDNVAVATMPAITGVVSLTSSLNSVTYNSGAIVSSGYTSPSFDLNENSLFDCLLLATGVIVAGNLRLDYSSDNVNWIPNNSASATISTVDPHFVYLGIKSGSRYVRVSSSATSTFTTTINLQIVFSSKRD